tara:strand:+ start:3043 stop:3228 length:186 start_codon:yes stop_codon:yes gene_type:complete
LSLIATYTLAKELHISPLESMHMPVSLVTELLAVHQEVEEYKKDKLEEHMEKNKSITNKMR